MSKKTRIERKSSKAGFLVTLILCAAAVFALGSYVRLGHTFVPSAEKRQTPADQYPTSNHLTRALRGHRDTPSTSPDDQTGTFEFKPAVNDGEITFQKQRIEVPADTNPKVYVINRYLQDTKIVDPGTRLLSVDIRDGIAYLYFNGAMDRTYGTDDESTLLNGILTNLGQFPDVKSALFYAQGKPIQSFGSVDLTEAQPVLR